MVLIIHEGNCGKTINFCKLLYWTAFFDFFSSSFCWQFRVNMVLTYLCKNSLKNTDKDQVASYLTQLPLFGGRDYRVR